MTKQAFNLPLNHLDFQLISNSLSRNQILQIDADFLSNILSKTSRFLHTTDNVTYCPKEYVYSYDTTEKSKDGEWRSLVNLVVYSA